MKDGVIIKTVVIGIIVALWMVPTYWAIRSCCRVWSIKEVDSKASWTLFRRAMVELVPNPFAKVAEGVREKSAPCVRFCALDGFTIKPTGPGRVTSELFADRKQYSLTVSNMSQDVMKDISWVVQLPYPVEHHALRTEVRSGVVRFAPAGGGFAVTVANGGTAEILRQPMSSSYELTISELQGNGVVELLLVLNSWRDPRGKEIPKGENLRYFIPQTGPQYTYIHGTYKIIVGDQAIEASFYAPFSLDDKKIVSLGSPTDAPTSLMRSAGMF